MTRFSYDAGDGILEIKLQDGVYEESLELAEPGFGAYMHIDRDGNVLGLEFLSQEEFTELITRNGGRLDIPDRVLDPAHFDLLETGC